MKTILKFFAAGILIIAASCAEENIEPLPTHDIRTRANGYWDQFLSIHLSTNFEEEITFYMYGTGGEMTVDWGDGSRETFFVDDNYTSFHHAYNPEEGGQDFAIRVSGDLSTIIGFDFFYSSLYVNEMHFGGLTNLRYLSMGMLAEGPPVINLSKNKSIESVILPAIQRLENLILPASNKIRAIDISGTNVLPTSVVDRVIARVHDSVVKSPRDGFFILPVSWAHEEGDLSMVGPPSSYSLNKLRKLRKKYGWNITPNIK